MDELSYWLSWNAVTNIGPVRLGKIIEYFGSAKDAWFAPAAEFKQLAGFSAQLCQQIDIIRPRIDGAKELAQVQQLGFSVLTLLDAGYPAMLREIYDPPPVLYLHGQLTPADAQAIAIVGSRKATAYGRQVAWELADGLASQGLTVVSGMARGIDTQAHRGALAANGRTIAVLGCGLDIIYPWENRVLKEEISRHGAVISEFPLGTPPAAANFPRRNRIISGLARGTVVVEAALQSGSLITADYALEQGRDVFAVPGSTSSIYSKGTHQLIKQGAKLVENVADILEELAIPDNAASGEVTVIPELNVAEAQLMRLLAAGPQHFDNLVRQSGLSVTQVSTALLNLELKGLVKQLDAQEYMALHG